MTPNGYAIALGYRAGTKQKHTGVDLSNAQEGGDVRAVFDGRVVHVQRKDTGWGHMIRITHDVPGVGVLYSQYAHLQRDSVTVELNDQVATGDVIGRVDCTGETYSTADPPTRCESNDGEGPHLHFEIKRRNQNDCGYIPSTYCANQTSADFAYFENPLAFIECNRIVNSPELFEDLNLVPIGHPGNPADTIDCSTQLTGNTFRNCGSVPYNYQISRYEITNEQYAEFLNAVDPHGSNPLGLFPGFDSLPNAGITRDGLVAGNHYRVKPNFANKPTTMIRWIDAARFVNWLAHDRPSGPEAHTLLDDGSYDLSSNPPQRQPNARWAIPSEDEWYKAAYYDPTKNGTGGYWKYATRSDDLPNPAICNSTGDITNPGSNVANHFTLGNYLAYPGCNWNGSLSNVTTIGSTGNQSFYGTADQSGNVVEWIDLVVRYFTGYLLAPLRAGGTGLGDGPSSVGSDIFSQRYVNAGFRVAFVGCRP